MNTLFGQAEASHRGAKEAARLKTAAADLEKDAAAAKTPADADRMRALAAIMQDGGARF